MFSQNTTHWYAYHAWRKTVLEGPKYKSVSLTGLQVSLGLMQDMGWKGFGVIECSSQITICVTTCMGYLLNDGHLSGTNNGIFNRWHR